MKTGLKINSFLGVLACLALLCTFMAGCKRDYLWYDADQQPGIYIVGGEWDTNYYQATGTTGWQEMELMVSVLGFTEDRDRYFEVEVVDSLTTIPADKYKFEDSYYISADKTWGYLRFSIAQTEKDSIWLGIRLLENENFRPVMTYQQVCVLCPKILTQPVWWACDNYMFGRYWTPRLHDLVVQFYMAVEETDPVIWNMYFGGNENEGMGKEMDKVSSKHYFGWISKMWLTPYGPLLQKYVARPLYDHLKAHPEDGDYNNMPNPYN